MFTVDGWAERRSCYIQIREAWAIPHRWIRKSLGREVIWDHERPEGEGHGGCFLYTLSASTPGSEGGVWHFCKTRTTEEGALPFFVGLKVWGPWQGWAHVNCTRSLGPHSLWSFSASHTWRYFVSIEGMGATGTQWVEAMTLQTSYSMQDVLQQKQNPNANSSGKEVWIITLVNFMYLH